MAKMEYRASADDAFKVAEVTLVISICKSQEELDVVARRIAASDFTDNDLKILRYLWSEKRADLQAPPERM